MRAASYLAWSLAVLAGLPCIGADWIRLRAPDIELLSDAGERSARDTLTRLARIRDLFPAGRSQPLRIFLFSLEKDFRDYAPGAVADGFYQSGPERDYIVLRSGATPARVVVHEYIHLLLNHGTAPLPLWFEEGTAELYSNLEFSGSRLVVGTVIPEHVSALGAVKLLNAAELSAVTRTSRVYDERSRAGIFYAESWALVHMLNLSSAYRQGMPRFAELLASGANSEAAFQQAFDRSMESALSELGVYFRQARVASVGGSTPAQPASIEMSRIAATEAALLRADLGLRTSHPEVARRWFLEIARNSPGSAASETAEAMLAMIADDRDTARAHIQKALALDASDAGLWFEFAMLERESGATRERVDELLRKTASLNPDFAEARFLLGVHATDDGRTAEAVAHLRAAVRVLPRQSSFWHALAFALYRAGQRQEAAEAAARAVRTAQTLEEEHMGQTLLDSLR
jgi:tetratricopeptide (TPR) repeat protein